MVNTSEVRCKLNKGKSMKKRTAGINISREEKIIKKDESVNTESIMSQVLDDRYKQAVFQVRFGN